MPVTFYPEWTSNSYCNSPHANVSESMVALLFVEHFWETGWLGCSRVNPSDHEQEFFSSVDGVNVSSGTSEAGHD